MYSYLFKFNNLRVVQPIRKMLQQVNPVIEEMKTIISKAGPPDGSQGSDHQQSQRSNYGGNQKSNSELIRINSADDNRFSRYGGNDLGRGNTG